MIPLNTEMKLTGRAGMYLMLGTVVQSATLLAVLVVLSYVIGSGGTCEGSQQICDFLEAGGHVGLFMGISFLVAALLMLYGFLWYRMFSFIITEQNVTVNSGVLFRHLNTIDFDKIQNINSVRGPLQMLMGVTNLQLWTANPSQMSIVSAGKNGGSRSVAKPDASIILPKEVALWLQSFIAEKQASPATPQPITPAVQV